MGIGIVGPHRIWLLSSLEWSLETAAFTNDGAGKAASQNPLGESLCCLTDCCGSTEGSSQQRSHGGWPETLSWP